LTNLIGSVADICGGILFGTAEADHPPPACSDVSNDEWALIAPCLILLREDAGKRPGRLGDLFNGPMTNVGGSHAATA
jgi:hypothetical protein